MSVYEDINVHDYRGASSEFSFDSSCAAAPAAAEAKAFGTNGASPKVNGTGCTCDEAKAARGDC